jgi:hypothetical protein
MVLEFTIVNVIAGANQIILKMTKFIQNITPYIKLLRVISSNEVVEGSLNDSGAL